MEHQRDSAGQGPDDPTDIVAIEDLYSFLIAGLIEVHRFVAAVREAAPTEMPPTLQRAIDQANAVLRDAAGAIRKLGGQRAVEVMSTFVAAYMGDTRGEKLAGDTVGVIVLRPTQSPDIGFMPAGVIQTAGKQMAGQAIKALGLRGAAQQAIRFSGGAKRTIVKAGALAKSATGRLFPSIEPALATAIGWLGAAAAFRLAAPGAKDIVAAIPWWAWVVGGYYYFNRGKD